MSMIPSIDIDIAIATPLVRAVHSSGRGRRSKESRPCPAYR
ncbi:hypothetical protein [Herbaspirillum sp.]